MSYDDTFWNKYLLHKWVVESGYRAAFIGWCQFYHMYTLQEKVMDLGFNSDSGEIMEANAKSLMAAYIDPLYDYIERDIIAMSKLDALSVGAAGWKPLIEKYEAEQEDTSG